MSTDFSYLFEQYPEVVSLEQLYQICHISKRKAQWLLEQGYIPCEDTGRKTWRFRIKTKDIVLYLTKRERNPNYGKPPHGIFSSLPRSNDEKHWLEYIYSIPQKQFKHHLREEWDAVPDALTADMISELTGYKVIHIRKWILDGTLQSVTCQRKTLVAKVWLIDFIASYQKAHPTSLSPKHQELIKRFNK